MLLCRRRMSSTIARLLILPCSVTQVLAAAGADDPLNTTGTVEALSGPSGPRVALLMGPREGQMV
jgi:hypothetical protein